MMAGFFLSGDLAVIKSTTFAYSAHSKENKYLIAGMVIDAVITVRTL